MEKRPFRPRQHLRRLLNEGRVARHRLGGPIAGHRPDGRGVGITGAAHDVFGDFDVDRPGTAVYGNPVRLPNDFRQPPPIAHAHAEFGDWLKHVNQAHVLERTAAIRVDDVAPPLPAEHDQRRALGVGGDDAGNHVGRARPNPGNDDGRFTGDTGIGFSHVGRRRLVARIDKAHVVLVEFGEEGVEAAVQNAKQGADAFLLEAFQQKFAAGHWFWGHGNLLVGWRVMRAGITYQA